MHHPLIPNSLQKLLEQIQKFPGVGSKTALRYCLSLLKNKERQMKDLERSLLHCREQISTCPECHFWKQGEKCSLCESPSRQSKVLCLVRDAADVLSIESGRPKHWTYHILGGLLSPIMGIGPQQLNISSLLKRLAKDQYNEIILALDANVEGEATSLFIKEIIQEHFPKITLSKASQGIPAGASVEYLDISTLESALEQRTPF